MADDSKELDDTGARFLAHWIAATIGFFLRWLLPILEKGYLHPEEPLEFPRWWVALLFAAGIALVGGFLNANLPIRSRELLKSATLGFAFDHTAIMANITPAG